MPFAFRASNFETNRGTWAWQVPENAPGTPTIKIFPGFERQKGISGRARAASASRSKTIKPTFSCKVKLDGGSRRVDLDIVGTDEGLRLKRCWVRNRGDPRQCMSRRTLTWAEASRLVVHACACSAVFCCSIVRIGWAGVRKRH